MYHRARRQKESVQAENSKNIKNKVADDVGMNIDSVTSTLHNADDVSGHVYYMCVSLALSYVQWQLKRSKHTYSQQIGS